jgi:hypothetical protein
VPKTQGTENKSPRNADKKPRPKKAALHDEDRGREKVERSGFGVVVCGRECAVAPATLFFVLHCYGKLLLALFTVLAFDCLTLYC